MIRKKVLLLNPPGEKVYIRDYYCSKVSKTNYLFPPIDLLVLSGRLAERYDIFLIDAIEERLSKSTCLSQILKISPDVVISLIGAVSLEEDRSFLNSLWESGRFKIIVSGDVVLEDPQGWLNKNPFLDAILLDFTSESIIKYIENEYSDITDIAYRTEGASLNRNFKRAIFGKYNLPVPLHELFNSSNYRFPLVKKKNFATVLTDYGCPFSCTFCIMGAIGYKYRSIDNVIIEFEYLKKIGKKEIFFMDQTFGINRERALALCKAMIDKRYNFGWVCFSRVDLIDEDLLSAMKNSGCHTIIFGVESANEEILRKYKKNYTISQIRNTFKLCKKYKVRTVATFILGLPEETMCTSEDTIRLLKEIDCNFASFNIAVPRATTPFRKELLNEGFISSNLEIMDQGGDNIVMPTRSLSSDMVMRLKRRAIRKFYLRPSYLWRRLIGISTLYELKENLSEGWHLIKGSLDG